VCKLTRRSPNAVARRRLKPQVDGTTPRPPDACLPAERCWLVKVTGGPPPPPKAQEVEGASQNDDLAQGLMEGGEEEEEG